MKLLPSQLYRICMNTIFLYLFSLLLPLYQTTPLATTRTYKYEYTFNNNEKQTDYIQLVFQDDSIIKGLYYSNEYDYRNKNNIHCVADIKFEKSEHLNFSLTNYMFCNENSNPFDKIKYTKKENLQFNLKDGVNFDGIISGKQLILRRVFYYYDSRFDEMTFNLVEEE
jgi:hypothetical protein